MRPRHQGKELYEFGSFRVDVAREILLRSGEAVPLTPKTFQVLLVLLRHASAGISKEELLKEVWPETFVEEANLSRTVFMLRKALGETPKDHRYIVTVPGYGYRLAADVVTIPEQELNIVSMSHSTVLVQIDPGKPWGLVLAVVLLLAICVGVFRLTRHSPQCLLRGIRWCLQTLPTPPATPLLKGHCGKAWMCNCSSRLS